MKIESLKDFKALVKACRALGVDAMEIGEIKFNLGPIHNKGMIIPIRDTNQTPSLEETIKVPQFNGPITDPEVPSTEQLTEDQLLFYSSQGHSELEQ